MINSTNGRPKPALFTPGMIYKLNPEDVLPPNPSPAANDPFATRPADPIESKPRDHRRFVAGQEVVPGYQLAGRIGGGGTGEVWKAVSPGGFPVAMKLIDLAGRHSAGEIRSLLMMRHIRHANLLGILGCWQLDDLFVVGMELADGSLMDRHDGALRRGGQGLVFPELVRFIEQAARGVDFLNDPRHSLPGRDGIGLLHRAIMPENLLLVGGSVKLGDFGKIELMDLAAGGCLLGGLNSAYAAPELLDGRPTRWSDQYSLAATYYHLRGGNPPLPVTSSAERFGGRAHRFEMRLIPWRERPVLARALSADPAGRWPDCLTLVRELAKAGRSGHRRARATTRVAPEPDRSRQDASAGPQRKLLRFGALTLMSLPFLANPPSPRPVVVPTRRPVAKIAEFVAREDHPDSPVVLPIRRPVVTTLSLADKPEVQGRDARGGITEEMPSGPADNPPDIIVAESLDPDRVRAGCVAAIEALVEPARGRIHRAAASLRSLIASMPPGKLHDSSTPGSERDDLPGRLAVGSPAEDAEDSAARTTTVSLADARVTDAVEILPASVVQEPTRVDPGPPIDKPPVMGESAKEPDKPRPAAPRAIEGPKTMTIVVWMPVVNAELVVRGAVGRGNPDEWYGPKRVIHSPPIDKIEDYLVGAFWTDATGRQMTRTKGLKVHPGGSYEVDLRISNPTSAEIKK